MTKAERKRIEKWKWPTIVGGFILGQVLYSVLSRPQQPHYVASPQVLGDGMSSRTRAAAWCVMCSARAPSPRKTLQGYNIVTPEPRLPPTQPMVPPALLGGEAGIDP